MDRKAVCYQLWLHYNKIKDDYHLSYRDIFRQIHFDYNDSHIKYLSIQGGSVLSQGTLVKHYMMFYPLINIRRIGYHQPLPM